MRRASCAHARGIALALLAVTARASAQPELADIESLDPIALARFADRAGDDAVLAALTAEPPSLGAIYAAPYLRAPEEALPRLVTLARGRDPFRAPAAMAAILAIAHGPMLEGMARREAEPLDPVLEALDALADDASAREDLRGAAALARAQLASP